MTRNVSRARWLRIGRWVMAGFFILVIVLVVRHARGVDWRAVRAAVGAYDARTLLLAGALVATSYLIYCGYDLAARRYAGHKLPTLRVMLIAFVSYAFSLNLGALIGGGGFRVRMYGRSGLGLACIGRVIASTVATNWIGYVLLAGALFAFGVVVPPEDWTIGRVGLRVLGGGMVLAVLAYFVACAVWHDRTWKVRGHKLRLPSLPLASVQLLLSLGSWMTMAGIIHVLLRQEVPYATVLGVFLLGAIAAAVVHIPAGLGVLEAVFIGLLGARVAEPTLLAALLGYRALYYLGPLVAAALLYGAFEARVTHRQEHKPR